jgi:hypothetical protein
VIKLYLFKKGEKKKLKNTNTNKENSNNNKEKYFTDESKKSVT